MNYRHAFHAGNFADCLKHTVLLWLLQALTRKGTPFFVLDSHAGTGFYDLQGDEAERTGEWQQGIGRLLDGTPAPLAEYVALIRRLGFYPGSPAIIRALLRPTDRLACCELHPEDAATLRERFAADPQVAVHRRDGWQAITALLPPAEKRGLVLIDPSFESTDDHAHLVAALQIGAQRFRNGIYATWYPIKHRAPVRAMQDTVRQANLRDVVCAEIWLRPPTDPNRLNGCGMMVMNPPYRFEAELPPALSALAARLGDPRGAGSGVQRLTPEAGQ
jgi:23S rRNA (adenine2030-N6)-methyltransferase